ncbi:hypothetical protein EEJ42_03410 [Streptomyces botrytidirepellens]|uniref:Uncharacterized protein n=1 Tax=Streptomyces botrytidirepellens TaxID=2486417 RepID=A0A3M8X6L9_9ACTN|nr:hypothetical protein EEJ42_03410 [Streptomyces botrytidirepellens]
MQTFQPSRRQAQGVQLGVKRDEHFAWPQPTRSAADAVTIAPHWRTAPINPATRARATTS